MNLFCPLQNSICIIATLYQGSTSYHGEKTCTRAIAV